ncbi:hypothetical protein [Rhodanobacter sp. C03]|uniref:hypothetical protein n=1 Tax=Rhodanobacter sp. C03 TaxID=1945858 RepID=UPI0009841918|nr:hypothetical protein [Rhodanobacter sp. C03]OOG59568.1 hypothetical protein B0E48_01785 [Rhodanobacter sp. C03]
MGTSSFAALAGMGMLGLLVMVVGGILLGALVLCLAFRIVVGYMPSYLRSIGVVLLTFVAVVVASVVLGMVLHGGAGGLLSVVVNFLVGAAVINYLLLAQDGNQIGYGKACLVQLVYMVIGFVCALVIGLIMAMVFGAAIFGMH